MAGPSRGVALTKDRILEEAIRLFARKGVDRTRMRDLAEALGVTEPALYKHFASKEAIFDAVFISAYARIADGVAAATARVWGFENAAREVVMMFARLFDEERDLFSFVLLDQHRHLPHVEDNPATNPVSALRELFEQAMATGQMRRTDPDLAAAVSLGVVVQAAMFTHYGRLKGSLFERVPALTAAAIAAVRAL